EGALNAMLSTQLKIATTAVLAVAVLAADEPGPARAEQPGSVTLLRTPDKGIQPQVVVDGKGVVHMVYFRGDPKQGDRFYVPSEAGGAKFSRPLPVNSDPGSAIAVGNIRGAHLAVGKNGRAHVAWNGPGYNGRPKEGMFYTRLNDKGTAFEPQR